ncbi:tripartite motif-containing protein 16-like, partial [Clarias magur]
MDEKTTELNKTADSDVSTRRKRKAEQSSPESMTSFRANQKDLHNTPHVREERKLVRATGNFKDSICPAHNKSMEIFCRKDQQCICNLCLTNRHKNHDVVLIEKEVPEKKVFVFYYDMLDK